MKHRQVTGQRFGRLVAKKRILRNRPNRRWPIALYECLCDCGKVTVVHLGNLGRCSNSCGCIRVDRCKNKRKPNEAKRITTMLGYYKRNAKIGKQVDEWRLTRKEFENIVKKPCFYCGLFDVNLLSGVDRRDNQLGYTVENSVPCCRWCNWGKNSRTIKEFVEWIERLYVRKGSFYSR